jgi:hypothetical protein
MSAWTDLTLGDHSNSKPKPKPTVRIREFQEWAGPHRLAHSPFYDSDANASARRDMLPAHMPSKPIWMYVGNTINRMHEESHPLKSGATIHAGKWSYREGELKTTYDEEKFAAYEQNVLHLPVGFSIDLEACSLVQHVADFKAAYGKMTALWGINESEALKGEATSDGFAVTSVHRTTSIYEESVSAMQEFIAWTQHMKSTTRDTEDQLKIELADLVLCYGDEGACDLTDSEKLNAMETKLDALENKNFQWPHNYHFSRKTFLEAAAERKNNELDAFLKVHTSKACGKCGMSAWSLQVNERTIPVTDDMISVAHDIQRLLYYRPEGEMDQTFHFNDTVFAKLLKSVLPTSDEDLVAYLTEQESLAETYPYALNQAAVPSLFEAFAYDNAVRTWHNHDVNTQPILLIVCGFVSLCELSFDADTAPQLPASIMLNVMEREVVGTRFVYSKGHATAITIDRDGVGAFYNSNGDAERPPLKAVEKALKKVYPHFTFEVKRLFENPAIQDITPGQSAGNSTMGRTDGPKQGLCVMFALLHMLDNSGQIEMSLWHTFALAAALGNSPFRKGFIVHAKSPKKAILNSTSNAETRNLFKALGPFKFRYFPAFKSLAYAHKYEYDVDDAKAAAEHIETAAYNKLVWLFDMFKGNTNKSDTSEHCTSRPRLVEMSPDGSRNLGILLAPNKGNGVGVHVSGIKPSSTAARVGIQVGDLILAINGQRVIDVSHAAVKAIVRTAATSGKQITIKVCGSKGD